MITVYNANSSIDAKLIQDQLGFADIPSHIMGDLLQGGVGELQPQGLVNVMVEKKHFKKARKIVLDWEKDVQIDEVPNHLKQKMQRTSLSKFVEAIYFLYYIFAIYLLYTFIQFLFF